MTTDDTFYDVLGVPTTADDEDIHQAYRRLSRQVHSDVGGSDVLFRLVRTAYEVLSDPDMRKRYDDEMGIVQPDDDNIDVDEVVDRLSSLLAVHGGITVGYNERVTPLRIVRVVRREVGAALSSERHTTVSDAISVALDGGEGYIVAEWSSGRAPYLFQRFTPKRCFPRTNR